MVLQDPTDQFWELFEDSPLFVKWRDFREKYLTRLELLSVPAQYLIYDLNTLPVYFYLVVEGVVCESWQRDDGSVWLRRDYSAGQFFGARALFPSPERTSATVATSARSPAPGPQEILANSGQAEKYRSTVRALTDVTLYRMTAADLRVATERNPELFEVLLQETRARRLRRVPLLHGLNDAAVRCLAEAFNEITVERDEKIVPGQAAGLWIIDWGRIDVTGPASLNRPEWPHWRLTSGNFFLADGPGLISGKSCIASSAQSVRTSCLFHLSIEAFERLVGAFPSIGEMLSQPLDIVSVLSRVDIFKGLSEGQREHLAQFCSWEFVPVGQNITTQGNIGHSFVILRRGAAIIMALDDRGRPRPRNYLQADKYEYYGRSSLLDGKPRDATVRAVSGTGGPHGQPGFAGAECILLDRRDMQIAFKEKKKLWPSETWLVRHTESFREVEQPYDWMEEGETVTWQDRPYIWWLIQPLAGVGVLFVLIVLLIDRLWEGPILGLPIITLILFGVIFIFPALWIITNYYNDYYVVTNRRVTRRDRVWLLYEARSEAPIDMVQDATIAQDLGGRLLNFGDLTIRTSAKPGTIVFDHVPDPERVKDIVLSGRGGAVAATFGQRKEILRRGVITGLNLALPIPERIRAMGAKADEDIRRKARVKPELLPGMQQPTAYARQAVAFLPEAWRRVLFGPTKPDPKPLPGQIIWRKSKINLLMRAGLALGCTLAWLFFGLALSLVINWLHLEPMALALPWLFVMVGLVFWTWWQWADWHNDIYVVTDDQIIDIEAKPLGLSVKRRAAGLDRVQTADSVQEGFIRNVLNYGDVIIRTAAGDEGFTFSMVANPKEVQSTIFKKLAEFQRRQEGKRAEERQRDIIEGLDVYHELRRSKLGEGP